MKIDATQSVRPWIAEHAGFLLMRIEVGRDGKTACEKLKGKSAKVQGMAIAENERRTLGKQACVWEKWHPFGCQSDDGGSHCGESIRRVVRVLFGENPSKRDGRSNWEMVAAVPWCKKARLMHGERLKSERCTKSAEKKLSMSWFRGECAYHARIGGIWIHKGV